MCLDIILYAKKIPVHMIQSMYLFGKATRKSVVCAYVDDDIFKKSGASSIDEFVCEHINDELYDGHEFHFCVDYRIHINQLIDLLEKLDIRGIFYCIINEERSRSIYLYFITKKEEEK